MNLLKGGQGRTEEDLTASAIAIIWIVGLAVALIIALAIRQMWGGDMK